MHNKPTTLSAKPFVKWAGGKGQLLLEIRAKYLELDQNISKYCEPFVGGGAVLFDMLSKQPNLQEILINDINQELINCYQQIKLHCTEIIDYLSELENSYSLLDEEAHKAFYYSKRSLFNDLKLHNSHQQNIEKACLFIFLNRTCFNGLYRVNKSNLFNVPFGSHIKPVICKQENIKKISLLLQKVQISSADYKECLPFIDHKTFVYIDPPYRPLTPTAKFISYTKASFNDQSQIELKNFVDELNSLGSKIIISNSDPKSIDPQDDFFDTLYKNYKLTRVSARRMINRNSDSRSKISELLISNF